MIEIQVTVGGKARVTVTGDKVKEVFEQAAFFQSLPACCPRCKQEKQTAVNYRFAHNQDKDKNNYYKLVCDAGHIASLGQHKGTETLFYRREEKWQTWKEITDSGGEKQEPAQTRKELDKPPANAYDDDFLPF